MGAWNLYGDLYSRCAPQMSTGCFLVYLMQLFPQPIGFIARAAGSDEVQNSCTNFHGNKRRQKPVLSTFRQESKNEDIYKRNGDY
jgi:hypothetical protein